MIAAHGNSLRGIVKHLDNMSDSDIMGLNLPTGIPFVYELDENFKPIKSMQFLGDEETVRKGKNVGLHSAYCDQIGTQGVQLHALHFGLQITDLSRIPEIKCWSLT